MSADEHRTDECGIAQTLGVVGDSWSWLILREIAGQVTRFDAIQGALGISRRALTERLGRLVDDGILVRRRYQDRPVRHDYLLTDRGGGLVPVLLAMQEFGDRYLLGDGSLTATAGTDSAEAARVHALTGSAMPAATLPTTGSGSVTVGDAGTGRWQVVFFFPGAYVPTSAAYPPGWGDIPGAPGCTLETRTYADRLTDFEQAGAEVVGISTQRPDEQAAFSTHAALPYPLASDEDLVLAAGLRLPVFRAAGVVRYKRQTMLVDPDGVIRVVQMPILDPAGSVDDMLAHVRALAG